MNNNYNGWYILYVKSRYERKINDLLKEALMESFLPQKASERQWSDRKKSKVLKVGDGMKVSYGSLYSLECEILRVNSQNEVLVCFGIDSLQQDIIATIPANLLTHNAIAS